MIISLIEIWKINNFDHWLQNSLQFIILAQLSQSIHRVILQVKSKQHDAIRAMCIMIDSSHLYRL